MLTSCGKEEWYGFVYPDRDDYENMEVVGIYDSFDECQNATLSRLTEVSPEANGDYQCGLNCSLIIANKYQCSEIRK